ncbi:Uncharacterised protein [Vibrio cholerae]|nr:Uncharacterised protein [Vibrio cholerae]
MIAIKLPRPMPRIVLLVRLRKADKARHAQNKTMMPNTLVAIRPDSKVNCT